MMNFCRIVGLAAALCALPARGDDWSGLGRDDARSRVASEILASPAALGAPLATGSESVASPVVADGYLVTAGLNGIVRAFRESDRALIWSRTLGGAFFATPFIERGRIYVTSSNGTMSVLRLADGATLWSSSTGSADQASPVVSAGRLFLARGFPYPSVTAFDVTSATSLWSQTLEQVSYSSPAIADKLLIVGCNSGKLYALDTATGAVAWTFLTDGPADFASPLVLGNDVYVAAGATLQRVSLDPTQWGSNWSATCVDPSPAPGAAGVVVTSSSPIQVGNVVVYVVRFVYSFVDAFGTPQDQRVLHEFACAMGVSSHLLAWQTTLADVTVPDVNGVPPYAVCPTPALMGTQAVVASSVDATLRLLEGSDGSEAAAFVLDAPCLASPIVANARITALTRTGTLYAFEGATPQPGAATGLTPDAASFTVTPSTLSWNSAGAGATYRVRIASDGEYLMNFDYEFVTTSTSIPCPALPTQHVYTWGVRVQNSALAYGPWSSASFKQNVPPAPPGALSAVAMHGKVLLTWMPSPSPSAVGYRLAYGTTGGALGAPADLGNVTSTTVSGLTNGTSYTFELRAVDALPDVSTPVTVDATPVSAIHIGGAAYDTLAAALAAALPGEVVQLGADTFLLGGTLALPAGVHLRGVNAHVTRIAASGPIVMVDAADRSSISLLCLSDGAVGVRATGGNVLVRNCVVRNMSQNGIEVYGSADVVNDTIVRNGSAGLRAWGLTHARNSIVQENGVGLAGTVVSRYNDVSDGYSVAIAGPGDLQSPVGFLDPPSGDFREAAQQPSLDAGDPADDFSLEPPLNGGRINQGAFGNTSLAATSLVATQPTPGSNPPKSSSGGCGLLGLEVLVFVVLARRRR